MRKWELLSASKSCQDLEQGYEGERPGNEWRGSEMHNALREFLEEGVVTLPRRSD